MFVGLVVIGWFALVERAKTPAVAAELRTQKLTVVDEAGKPRVAVSVTPAGSGYLGQLYGKIVDLE